MKNLAVVVFLIILCFGRRIADSLKNSVVCTLFSLCEPARRRKGFEALRDLPLSLPAKCPNVLY